MKIDLQKQTDHLNIICRGLMTFLAIHRCGEMTAGGGGELSWTGMVGGVWNVALCLLNPAIR